MRKIITYQPDGFFLLLTALKIFNVAKAILKIFALLKEKITSSFLVGYLLPHPLRWIYDFSCPQISSLYSTAEDHLESLLCIHNRLIAPYILSSRLLLIWDFQTNQPSS